MQLDLRALHPSSCVFVAANAGAGKTSLLTSRVLSLLLHGAEPGKILCLTFTKAAAAEMQARIQQQLGRWVMMNDEGLREQLAALLGHAPESGMLAHARSLFARVLDAPQPPRIQTIHSFCQSLLRRFPLEASVSPHFSLMDARTEQELLAEAKRRLLGQAAQADPQLSNAIASMAQQFAESTFQGVLKEIIQNKRKFRALLRGFALERAQAQLWEEAGFAPQTTCQNLMEAHFSYASDERERLWGAGRKLAAQEKSRPLGEALLSWLSAGNERPLLWPAYRSFFLTQKDEPRKKLCADAPCQEALATEQARVVAYDHAQKRLRIVENTLDLLAITEGLLAIYDALKRDHARMDYDDLIMHSKHLLETPGVSPWVLFKLDGGIDHVLVDEAQDTSPEQWAIIKALTEDFFSGESRSVADRSLFVVGDEKQSIFSFQGADVSLLAAMQEFFSRRIEAARQTVHTIKLTHSFRSTPEILQAVDAVFAQPGARDGLTSHDLVLSHIAVRSQHRGLVELWPCFESDERVSGKTKMVRALTRAIRLWLDEGRFLPSRGRAMRPGDIVILVRSRGQLVGQMVRALKRAQIPVAGIDRMELTRNLAVQDLIALGRFALLPNDELTLAALLKSPLCDISEEQLFSLAYGRAGHTLWQRLQAMRHEGPAFAMAYEFLSEMQSRADFTTPYEFYAHALDTLGMRRRIIGRMGDEYADPMDEFLSQALSFERGHTPSLQGFLQWLASSESEIKRDPEQEADAVRIMTVHTAKGLQAPVVILPDTMEPDKLQDERLFWQQAGEGMIPLWLLASKENDARAALVRNRHKERKLQEYRRLLYVAMTRAQDFLCIAGATGRDKPPQASWYQLVRDGLVEIAPPFEHEAGQGLRVGEPLGCAPKDAPHMAGVSAGPPRPAHPSWEFLFSPAPSEPAPPKPLIPSRMEEAPPGASPLQENFLYARGKLIHALLQYLPDIADDAREQAALTYLHKRQPDWTADQAQALVDEVLQVMRKPDWAFLFSPGSKAEVPITGMVMRGGSPVAVSGQIDRLYVGEQEVWIVDFKSNRDVPKGAMPSAYLRQLALYRQLISQIYTEKTVRCAILWTAAPALSLLDEGALRAYI